MSSERERWLAYLRTPFPTSAPEQADGAEDASVAPSADADVGADA